MKAAVAALRFKASRQPALAAQRENHGAAVEVGHAAAAAVIGGTAREANEAQAETVTTVAAAVIIGTTGDAKGARAETAVAAAAAEAEVETVAMIGGTVAVGSVA